MHLCGNKVSTGSVVVSGMRISLNLRRELVKFSFTNSQALVNSTLMSVHNALECRVSLHLASEHPHFTSQYH
jgi:hypothetical protein